MLYSVLLSENIANEGLVKITSNIVSITGISNPNELDYINNEMVDLREDGYYVKFDKGFSLDGNFLIMLTGKGFELNKPFLTLNSDEITLYWRKGDILDNTGKKVKHAFIELKSGDFYVIFSNPILYPDKDDITHFWFRRVNGLYQIKIANLGKNKKGEN